MAQKWPKNVVSANDEFSLLRSFEMCTHICRIEHAHKQSFYLKTLTPAHAHPQAHVRANACTHTHAHAHTPMHMHTHTRTQTLTHAPSYFLTHSFDAHVI